jgi:hypothetical protein
VPEPDATFDLAIAFTLFSSMPDGEISAGIARELGRLRNRAASSSFMT